MFDFAVGLRDFDMFEAVGIIFFDEGDNFISAKVPGLFSDRMNESDGAVDFSFSNES